jgi:hypothetical protein
MKTLLSIEVKGKSGKNYSFNFYGDPKYLDEWREDGLEIDEVINTIPEWIVMLGLTKGWIFFQDIFNFKFIKRK